MIESPLLSSRLCDDINNQVKEKVDKGLFVFMHYNLQIVPVCSYQGKFLMGVNNFYKIMVDASVCKNINKIVVSKTYEKHIDIINKHFRLASNLRTPLGHNLSSALGNEQPLKSLHKWLKKESGIIDINDMKDEDYQKPFEALSRCAENTIISWEEIIDLVSCDKDKDNIIGRWYDEIINKYVNKNSINSKKIIEQLIFKYYIEKYSPNKKGSRYTCNEWLKTVYEGNNKYINENGKLWRELCELMGKKKELDTLEHGEIIKEKYKELEHKRKSQEELSKIVECSVKEGNQNYGFLNSYVGYIQDYIKESGKDLVLKGKSKDLMPENLIMDVIDCVTMEWAEM